MEPVQITLDPSVPIILLFVITVGVAIGRWITARPPRACPRCGGSVKVGRLECDHCDFDFNTIGGSSNGPT